MAGLWESGRVCGTHPLIAGFPAYPAHCHPKWALRDACTQPQACLAWLVHPHSCPQSSMPTGFTGWGVHFYRVFARPSWGMKGNGRKECQFLPSPIILKPHSPEHNCQLSTLCFDAGWTTSPITYSCLLLLPSNTPQLEPKQRLGCSIHMIRGAGGGYQ